MKPLVLIGALLMSHAVTAESTLQVTNAWVREAPPGAAMLAAYMHIHNTSDKTRTLTGVESPLFNHVMLHQSLVVDGVAKMLHQDNLDIPAGGSLVLKPGSYHLMMPSPNNALTLGQTVVFTLHMKNGERIQVKAIVKRAGDKHP